MSFLLPFDSKLPDLTPFTYSQGTIPKEFGSLRNLQRIDLDNNLIEGSIPTTLYSLTNLRQFDINDNSLTGTISTLIGQLGELSFFQVNNNRLTGTIPSELGKLSSLGKHLTQFFLFSIENSLPN